MTFHSAGLLNRILGDEIMLILNYLSPGYFGRCFKHFIKGFMGVKCCWIAFNVVTEYPSQFSGFEAIRAVLWSHSTTLCVSLWKVLNYVSAAQCFVLVIVPCREGSASLLMNFCCWLFSFVCEKLLNLFPRPEIINLAHKNIKICTWELSNFVFVHQP